MKPYWQLLRQNQFRINATRWPMTVLSAGCSVVNSTLGGLQHLIHGNRINETRLNGPPIFIVGHWRSGTTLMHELLSLDSKLAFPSTYDAFVPEHSLVSRKFFMPIMNLLMPAKRPMDNMSMGAASPQEDDFALLSLNSPTPYRKIAFPLGRHNEQLKLDPENLSSAELEMIKRHLAYFYNVLTLQYEKQLVVKSPPHTGRIKMLADLFPGAKFVHMSRHPHKLVPSTKKLWQLLYYLQAFQVLKNGEDEIIDYIFECKDLMYRAYFRDREMVDADQLIEIRFEDLVANPLQVIERVYRQLSIDGYDELAPHVKAYFDRKSDHQTSRYPDDENLNDRINTHWQEYMSAFGYEA